MTGDIPLQGDSNIKRFHVMMMSSWNLFWCKMQNMLWFLYKAPELDCSKLIVIPWMNIFEMKENINNKLKRNSALTLYGLLVQQNITVW